MDEKNFLTTMIETIKYDDDYSKNRDSLLALLRYSLVEFEKTKA